MTTPILYRMSHEKASHPSPPSSPLPMDLSLNEKVEEYAKRLFCDYTPEQNALYLRENPKLEAVRQKLVQRYKEEAQYTAALTVAIDSTSVEKKREWLDSLILPLVSEDAFSHINRLIEATVIERQDAAKYKVGIAYAEKGNFIRALEVYFFLSRAEWKNRFMLAVMRYIPEAQKNEFFAAILSHLLIRNEVEQAVDAVKKYKRVDSQALYRDIVNYLLEARFLDKLSIVLNELPREVRSAVLGPVLAPLLLNGALAFALDIVKPLKDNRTDPLFYEEIVFSMGKFMIDHSRMGEIHLICNALETKKDELNKLIPPQPMND